MKPTSTLKTSAKPSATKKQAELPYNPQSAESVAGFWEGAKIHLKGKVIGKARRRGKQKTPVKQQVTLRLSSQVLRYFKSGGQGWQTRLDSALCKLVARA